MCDPSIALLGIPELIDAVCWQTAPRTRGSFRTKATTSRFVHLAPTQLVAWSTLIDQLLLLPSLAVLPRTQLVSGSFSWDQSRTGATSSYYQYRAGYLATLQFASESAAAAVALTGLAGVAYLGARDNDNEGYWAWFTGPEYG